MPDRRCPCCGARALAHLRHGASPEPGARLVCEWCGARFATPSPEAAAPGAGSRSVPEGWLLDDYTMRALLAGRGLDFRADAPLHGGPRGHGEAPAAGTSAPFAVLPPRDVTLAVLARTQDRGADRLAAWARDRGFAETIVVQDGPAPRPVADAKVIAHPLAGDFAAQRNRAQRAARTPWLLHLDTDERLDDALARHLAALLAIADRDMLDAVGFARANLVGGAAADLWPDTQYRLVRASVRFRGRVHERPDACDDWRRTMTVLSGGRSPDDAPAIRHDLDRAHVVERTGRYDALGQDEARRADEAALLRPYEP